MSRGPSYRPTGMAFHPYLNFGGDCREAFTRYKEIFGGELYLMTSSEMPSEEPASEELGDLIVHAALTTPNGDILMASDARPGEFGPVQGMYVNYTVADAGEAERVFGALAEGGTIEMAYGQTFWSPGFGICVDRFGTPWMVNVEAPAPS